MNYKQILWSTREAFELTAGNYGAWLVPSLGANVVRLWYNCGGQQFELIRTPANAEILLNDPYAYGIPILFPANRVAGGYYEWEGIRYVFPQNYPNGVHIHGVLHNRPWMVMRLCYDTDSVWVRMELNTTDDKELWQFFPLEIKICLEIGISEKGLVHIFTVTNNSEHSFPVGLAYHTAFNIPFCPSSTPDDVRIIVPINACCVDDPIDRLPTGETRELDGLEKHIASDEGGLPLEKQLDYLYTSCLDKPQIAILRDMAAGWEITYTAGTENKYWILWNATAKEGFISIEPQTWMSNAMKQRNPLQFGAILVAPGKQWSTRTDIALRQCEKD
jgi:aldose 1-epimerase